VFDVAHQDGEELDGQTLEGVLPGLELARLVIDLGPGLGPDPGEFGLMGTPLGERQQAGEPRQQYRQPPGQGAVCSRTRIAPAAKIPSKTSPRRIGPQAQAMVMIDQARLDPLDVDTIAPSNSGGSDWVQAVRF
jgi:hypothetical protein